MFTENIHRVLSTSHMNEACDASGNCVASAVIREVIVVLVELGMQNGSSIDYRFVVTKHNGVSINWESKVSKGDAEIDDLICASPGCNIF